MSVTKSTQQKQALAEARRRKAEEDRRRKEAESQAQLKAYKAKAGERKANEKAIQSKRARSAALKMKAQEGVGDDYVLPPKGVSEKEMNWTGTLEKKALNVTGKKKELLTLVTADGKKVVFSEKAVVDFSLKGINLSLYSGKDVNISGKAWTRRTAEGTVYMVSLIKTATLKSSAIYDDLME